jgi:hypothetical protein
VLRQPEISMNLSDIISKIKATDLMGHAVYAANHYDYGGLVYIIRIALDADRTFTMKFGEVDDLANLIRTN